MVVSLRLRAGGATAANVVVYLDAANPGRHSSLSFLLDSIAPSTKPSSVSVHHYEQVETKEDRETDKPELNSLPQGHHFLWLHDVLLISGWLLPFLVHGLNLTALDKGNPCAKRGMQGN